LNRKQSKLLNQANFVLDNLKNQIFGAISKLIISPNGIPASLVNLSLLIIVTFLLKNIIKYIAVITTVKFEEGIVKTIRDRIFTKLTSLSIGYYTKNKQGNLISIIANETTALSSTTIASFSTIIRESIQVFLFAILLLSISPQLTLISSVTAVVSIVIIRIARKYLRKYALRMQTAMSNYTSTMQESFYGIRIIKAYSAEEHINNRFFSNTMSYVKSAIKHKKIITLLPAFNEVAAISALTFVLYFGGLQVINKQLTSDDLMLFLFSLFSIMAPITSVINNFSHLPRGRVAAEKIFEILNYDESIKSGNVRDITLNDKIEFKNVTFGYTDKKVLDNVSFILPKGKVMAIVGASGSGKSTILDLIVRFYDPNSGTISFDNKNIIDFDLHYYRKMFGIVSQETTLFNDTIENNIKFGREYITEEQIISATKHANAFSFISTLPEGFQTIIGDRGVQLSGGERQRIAIARALLDNPQVLIFDEATSALDNESEKIVQTAINEVLNEKTAIIVAHRLSTVVNADIIMVLKDGKIVETGNHKELLSKDGIYKKLYEMQ
jgi:subfamily B ATP-binding cassette protein MsbA